MSFKVAGYNYLSSLAMEMVIMLLYAAVQFREEGRRNTLMILSA